MEYNKQAKISLWIPIIAFCVVMAVLLIPKNIAGSEREHTKNDSFTVFIPSKEGPESKETVKYSVETQKEGVNTKITVQTNDSRLIHSDNLIIYGQAVENIRLFDSLGPNSYQKIYYNSLNLDAKTGTAMEHYYASAIIANYYFVRDNILYVLKEDSMPLKSDLGVLNYMAGKCDEQSYLLTSLLRSVGLESFPVKIPSKKHMVTAVRFDGMTQDKMKGYFITIDEKSFMVLDTTCNNCDVGTLPEMDKDQAIEVVDI